MGRMEVFHVKHLWWAGAGGREAFAPIRGVTAWKPTRG